jgi:hypothetical protein
VPAEGEYGGPRPGLTADERERFEAGRLLFDRDVLPHEGVGAPRFNGEFCRACDTDPVMAGPGPRGVDVVRHGPRAAEESFIPPAPGTILHRETMLPDHLNLPQAEASIFEIRRTPHLFGLGLSEAIADAEILSRVDGNDVDADGISGRAGVVDGARLGRSGWKAQVPNIAEFVRDAATAEIGLTVAWRGAPRSAASRTTTALRCP